jgi:hypothetical protein
MAVDELLASSQSWPETAYIIKAGIPGTRDSDDKAASDAGFLQMDVPPHEMG